MFNGKVLTSDCRKNNVSWEFSKTPFVLNEVLGWQQSTQKIHILEFYDEFDSLHNNKCCDKAFVTALPPPCNNLAIVSKYKVVPRYIVATLWQCLYNLVISAWAGNLRCGIIWINSKNLSSTNILMVLCIHKHCVLIFVLFFFLFFCYHIDWF